jgi:hypothetical protein
MELVNSSKELSRQFQFLGVELIDQFQFFGVELFDQFKFFGTNMDLSMS